MDNRAWLYRYRNQLDKIHNLERRLEKINIRISSVKSPSYSNMPKGGSRKTAEDYIVDKIEIEGRIKNMEESAIQIRREIITAIDKISDANVCEPLEYKFINGMSDSQIGDLLGYSPRHVQRLISTGVAEIQPPGTDATTDLTGI